MGVLASTSHTGEYVTGDVRKRGCLFYVKRGLKWLAIILVVLVLLGVGYQTLATELDRRNFTPRGQLYSVNGHQMHIVCAGEGSPAVILQAGSLAESTWWYRVQAELAARTQVCAFDRPSMGWSEPVDEPRTAPIMNGELHALLQEAGISGPYVMAGHSFGASLTRIYAAEYPDEVAGIALVDSHLVTPKHFASQGDIDSNMAYWNVVSALSSALTRVGVTRIVGNGDFQRAGYPPELVPELTAMQARNQAFDAYYAENGPAFPALQEASARAEDLGDLPMMVIWAGQTYGTNQANPSLRPLAEELSTYSSNSASRIVEGADHLSILGNAQYARQVTSAILDVIDAAQTGVPLAQ
ncbi:MAG: alpha/beta hydrolase [Anaerolineae bacterium]|nr:alpha/beta hydrolase [Anaerolineae bacterium]